MWLFEAHYWTSLSHLGSPSLPTSPSTEAGFNWLELPLVVREKFVRRLVGYVFIL